MDVADFDFRLPAELIAQAPPPERGMSRLLVLDRATGATTHHVMAQLPELLSADDLLVLNDTKVFPARLLGRRMPSGGAVECMLLDRIDHDRWEALVHPGQKLGPGALVVFTKGGWSLHAEILERKFYGRRVIRLWAGDGSSLDAALDAIGHVPLPPYIRRPDIDRDRDRYQTIYARHRGSVAAPTAGLHFTAAILDELARRGVERTDITLHVGYGTFQPIRSDRVEDHRLEPERFTVDTVAASVINRAIEDGRRVVAVGTTTTRTLESLARQHGRMVAGEGVTRLFIYPGFDFAVVGALLTNFHLPRSSLLMLVCAFAGRERVMAAYQEAIASRYRFYSYGDAMLIL